MACLGLMAGLVGCAQVATLSEPRSDAFVDTMAEAKRHHHAGRMKQAAAAFGRAAEHASRRVDQDEALYRKAKALEELGKHAKALELLDWLAERRPVSRRTARARYDAALLREELGRREAALRGFRHVAREHPESGLAARAIRHVLWDYEDRGDTQGALRYLGKLYEQVRDTDLGDDVLAFRADLWLETGRRDKARATLETIVRRYPYPQGGRWDNALWQLADMAVEDGRPEAAIRWLERMVRRREQTNVIGSYTLPTFPKAQLRIARLHRKLGHHEAAADHFQELYERYEHSRLRDDARVELGEMWLEAGQREQGCEILRDAVEEFEVGSARRRAAERVDEACR